MVSEWEEIFGEITGLQALSTGNLGFFSKPFLAGNGPYKGKIIKLYRPVKKLSRCQALVKNHDIYVPLLKEAGIKVPVTSIRIVNDQGKFRLVIIQEPFETHELVRGIMETAAPDLLYTILQKLLDDAAVFIHYIQSRKIHDLGFHPTLRNYAYRDGTLYYFDTFPPMACTNRRMKRVILFFAPYKAARWFWILVYPFMGMVTHEYYHPAKMVYGLIGSTCRLRPELAGDILEFSRNWVSGSSLDILTQRQLQQKLQNPPSLPWIWVKMRKWLGKEGKPNIIS